MCTTRFNQSVINEVNNICDEDKRRRKERDAGITATIAVVSAVIVTARRISSEAKSKAQQKDIENLKELTLQLDKQLDLLRTSVITSNTLISAEVTEIKKNLVLLSELISATPEMIDSLGELSYKFHEVQSLLKQVKKKISIGSPVPIELLELFNLTDFVTESTLTHSAITQCQTLEDNNISMNLAILNISEGVDILRADPFTYWSASNGSNCRYVYSGPEYILYNISADCARPLHSGEIIDNTLLGLGCTTREPIKHLQVYEAETCIHNNKSNLEAPKIQIKHHGQRLYVNCQGHFIIIDGSKLECPNHVFALMEDHAFSISEYSYSHHTTIVGKPKVSYVAPSKINLMLGTASTEFKSLSAEEIQRLQTEAESAKRKSLTEELTKGPSKFDASIRAFNSIIDSIGEYVAVTCALVMLVLFVKGKLAKKARASATATMVILMVLNGVLAYDHLIPHPKNMEEANSEIRVHQAFMQKQWCNEWRFYDEWDEFATNGGYYAHTLACKLAQEEFDCPCEPTKDWIPVVTHGRRDKLPKYVVDECPLSHLPELINPKKIDLYKTFNQYLCKHSRSDDWPHNEFARNKYGRVIAAGCLLARKMTNCMCISQDEHLPVILDGVTKQVTNEIAATMKQNKNHCDALKKQENKTSIHDMFFKLDANERDGYFKKRSG